MPGRNGFSEIFISEIIKFPSGLTHTVHRTGCGYERRNQLYCFFDGDIFGLLVEDAKRQTVKYITFIIPY